MKIVGLTGGIGSGKTTVANMFGSLGVPVYTADKEAKVLMANSKIIRRQLIAAFGEDAYNESGLNREFLANKIFKDERSLQKINSIIHPKVAQHFKKWLKKQNAPYIIKEAAIIFENNLQHQYNLIITVIADVEIRIQRILERDNTSKEKIHSIIENQLLDEEKIAMSDFVIENHDLNLTQKAVLEIHNKILQRCVK